MGCTLGAVLLSFFSSRSQATTIIYTNYPAVTNIVFTPTSFAFGITMTVTWDYRLALIDANQFTISADSFSLDNGSIGGAVWGAWDCTPFDVDEFIVDMSVAISGAGTYGYNDQQVALVPCGGGMGAFTVFNNVGILTNYPPADYRTGSPIDDGTGHTAFHARFFVAAFTDGAFVFNPGALTFLCSPNVRAIFDVQPISSATVSNLPPQNSPTSQTILSSPAGPIPPSLDIPDYIYQLGGLYVTGIARQGNDININWHTVGGATSFVQRCTSVITSNYTDISGPIVVLGNGTVITNYLDVGGVTNGAFGYYRIRNSN